MTTDADGVPATVPARPGAVALPGGDPVASAARAAEALVAGEGTRALGEAVGLLDGVNGAALGLYVGRWASDRRPALRLLALEAAELLPIQTRRALLGLLLADRRRDVRRRAGRSFVRVADLRDGGDRERVAALLAGDDEALRAGVAEEVVRRLATTGGEPAPELLAMAAPLLGAGEPRVVLAVARGLADWRPRAILPLPEAAGWARRALAGPPERGRRPAALVVAALARQVPDRVWPLVRAVHAGGDARTRRLVETVVAPTAFTGGRMPRDEAWTWATDPEPRRRAALARALGGVAAPVAAAVRGRPRWHRDLLRHLLVDPVPAVRVAALAAARPYLPEPWLLLAARDAAAAPNRQLRDAGTRLLKAYRKGR
jgi:hypothetical protein